MIDLFGWVTHALVMAIGALGGYIVFYSRAGRHIDKFKATVHEDQAKFRADLAKIFRRQAEEATAALDQALESAAGKKDELRPVRDSMAATLTGMLSAAGDNPLLLQEINRQYFPKLYRMLGQLDGIREETAKTKIRFESLSVGLVQLSEGFWQMVQAVSQNGLTVEEITAIDAKLKVAHQALGTDLSEGLRQMNDLFREMRRVAEAAHFRSSPAAAPDNN